VLALARVNSTVRRLVTLLMKRVVSSAISLVLCSLFVFAQQTATARLHGTVVDREAAPIPKVKITVTNTTHAFEVVSDENGRFQIDLPPGKYEMRSDKLPGFAVTKREISVATNGVAEVTIVPAFSEEGLLCILRVTGNATPKRRSRKRLR
jgi:Carboxypeptidase regulatory-like domain